MNPSEFQDETYRAKTRGMGLLYGEKCMILASAAFAWITRVTDGQMNGQTDRIAIAYARLAYVNVKNFPVYNNV